jgi:hypothetical protein
MMAASMALPAPIRRFKPFVAARTILSLALAVYFAFGVLAPLAAGEDAGLPMCCRRHGAHHCAMSMMFAERATALGWRPAACPRWPRNATVANFASLVAPVMDCAAGRFAFISASRAKSSHHAMLPIQRRLGLRGPPSRTA